MPNLPSGVIIAWPSTAASIPSGYSRYTALDSRYVRAAVTAGGTGGATSHSHTIPSHNHTQNSHTHSLTVGQKEDGLPSPVGLAVTVAQNTLHTHTGNSNSATPTNIPAVSNTTGTAANDPLYLDVIWIQSDGTAGIPVGAIAWWADAVGSLPAGWSQDAAALDRYLRGAAPSGDGGGTGGASSHDHTAPSHTHATQPHYHWIGQLGSTSLATWDVVSGTEWDVTLNPHDHNVTFNSGSAYITNQSATPDFDTEDIEPDYVTLHSVSRASGDDCPTGVIAIWTGLKSAIPANWVPCDGTGGSPTLIGDTFIRSTGSGESALQTGGSASHTHPSDAHNHTQNAHSHTGGLSFTATPHQYVKRHYSPGQPNSRDVMDYLHMHTVSLANATGTNKGTGITTGAANFLPLYTDVIFIQYQGVAAPQYRYVVSTWEPTLDRVHVGALLEDTLVYRGGIFDPSAPSIDDLLPVIEITSCVISVDSIHVWGTGELEIHYTNSAVAMQKVVSADGGETWS